MPLLLYLLAEKSLGDEAAETIALMRYDNLGRVSFLHYEHVSYRAYKNQGQQDDHIPGIAIHNPPSLLQDSETSDGKDMLIPSEYNVIPNYVVKKTFPFLIR